MRNLMPDLCKRFILVILNVAVIFSISEAASGGEPANPLSLPPLFYSTEDTEPVNLNKVTYALGPLIEYTRNSDTGNFLAAFRPMWSAEQCGEIFATDVIWPVFTYRDYRDEWNWRFLLYYTSAFKNRDAVRDRICLIPFWFSGHCERNDFYWAFFPVYGNVSHLLGYDKISFVLFPIWLRTERMNESGEAWLWPLINWDSGPRYDKLRIFPFYAYHHRFGQLEYKSVLWPLWHTTESKSVKNPGGGWLFWPLLGHTYYEKPQRSAWSMIWPLFQVENFKFNDREDGDSDGFGINCPWPVFQYKRNIREWWMHEETRWQLYIWPLWGRREKEHSSYSFYLWPLGAHRKVEEHGSVTEFIWALPLYWSKDAWDRNGEKEETYWNAWPFVSYFRDREKCEIRSLDIWPFRNFPIVKRNFDSFWTLFRYQSNERGSRQEWLWGLCCDHSAEYSAESKIGKRKVTEKCFAVYPFYEHFGLMSRPAGAESRDDQVDLEINNYFFSALRFIREKGESAKIRLFWFWEF